jgi:hypothetical protein
VTISTIADLEPAARGPAEELTRLLTGYEPTGEEPLMGIFEWSLSRLAGEVPDPSGGRERFDAALSELVKGVEDKQWGRPLGEYLEALQAWLEDSPGYYANRGMSMPLEPWALLADAIVAAKDSE